MNGTEPNKYEPRRYKPEPESEAVAAGTEENTADDALTSDTADAKAAGGAEEAYEIASDGKTVVLPQDPFDYVVPGETYKEHSKHRKKVK